MLLNIAPEVDSPVEHASFFFWPVAISICSLHLKHNFVHEVTSKSSMALGR